MAAKGRPITEQLLINDAANEIPQTIAMDVGAVHEGTPLPDDQHQIGYGYNDVEHEGIKWQQLTDFRYHAGTDQLAGRTEEVIFHPVGKEALPGEPFYDRAKLSFELKFDGKSKTIPSENLFKVEGDISAVPDEAFANFRYAAALNAGDEYLRTKLIPAALEENYLTGEEVKPGVLVSQFPHGDELWSVGVAADVKDGKASIPFLYVTDGKDRYAEFHHETVTEVTPEGRALVTKEVEHKYAGSIPPALAEALGKRGADHLAQISSIQGEITSGRAAEDRQRREEERDNIQTASQDAAGNQKEEKTMAAGNESDNSYTFERKVTIGLGKGDEKERWEIGLLQLPEDAEGADRWAARKEGTDLVYSAEYDAKGVLRESTLDGSPVKNVPATIRDSVQANIEVPENAQSPQEKQKSTAVEKRSEGIKLHDDYADAKVSVMAQDEVDGKRWVVGALRNSDGEKANTIVAINFTDKKAYAYEFERENGQIVGVEFRNMISGEKATKEERESIPGHLQRAMEITAMGEGLGNIGEIIEAQSKRPDRFRGGLPFTGNGLSDEELNLLRTPDKELGAETRKAKKAMINDHVGEFLVELENLDVAALDIAKRIAGEEAYQAHHRGFYSVTDTDKALDKVSRAVAGEEAWLQAQDSDAADREAAAVASEKKSISHARKVLAKRDEDPEKGAARG